MATKNKQLKITLLKSLAKALPVHKACVRGLGLRRIRHSVVVEDTPANRGMINKVSYLIQIENQ